MKKLLIAVAAALFATSTFAADTAKPAPAAAPTTVAAGDEKDAAKDANEKAAKSADAKAEKKAKKHKKAKKAAAEKAEDAKEATPNH